MVGLDTLRCVRTAIEDMIIVALQLRHGCTTILGSSSSATADRLASELLLGDEVGLIARGVPLSLIHLLLHFLLLVLADGEQALQLHEHLVFFLQLTGQLLYFGGLCKDLLIGLLGK